MGVCIVLAKWSVWDQNSFSFFSDELAEGDCNICSETFGWGKIGGATGAALPSHGCVWLIGSSRGENKLKSSF